MGPLLSSYYHLRKLPFSLLHEGQLQSSSSFLLWIFSLLSKDPFPNFLTQSPYNIIFSFFFSLTKLKTIWKSEILIEIEVGDSSLFSFWSERGLKIPSCSSSCYGCVYMCMNSNPPCTKRRRPKGGKQGNLHSLYCFKSIINGL